MREIRVAFDDANAYERYMGRWSRAVGERFLAWLAPPEDARWLDVGCGTGAFSQLVVARCKVKSLSGIDPSQAQIEHARAKLPDADLRVGDSMALPFNANEFDVVASALVLHFIPNRSNAFAEMKRVSRSGGLVAGYTWARTASDDFAPYEPMLRSLLKIGVEPMRSPTIPEQTADGLRNTAEAAGLSDVEIDHVEATQTFRDFEHFWDEQTLAVSPVGKTVAKLNQAQAAQLRATLQATLPIAADGSITYSARAIAFKGRV